MATFDYLRSRETANRLITKFGQSAAIRRVVSAANPDPFEPDAGAPQDFPCTVVILDYNSYDRASTLIEAGDKRALVAVKGLTMPALSGKPDSANTPTDDDQFVVNGQVHNIVNVNTLSPGGTIVLWDLQVRR